VIVRRGRRSKQLLNNLKEKRRYWKLKEEALGRTLLRTRFGRFYGPVVRQTTGCMNECVSIVLVETTKNCLSIFVCSEMYSRFWR
jgi:hypothetical protein